MDSDTAARPYRSGFKTQEGYLKLEGTSHRCDNPVCEDNPCINAQPTFRGTAGIYETWSSQEPLETYEDISIDGGLLPGLKTGIAEAKAKEIRQSEAAAIIMGLRKGKRNFTVG